MISPILLLAADAAAGSTRSLLDYIRSGGVIGAIILALSVVAVAVILAHLIRTRRSVLVPPDIAVELERRLRTGDLASAAVWCNDPENRCVLTRTVGPALKRCSRSEFGLLELRSALMETGSREIEVLQRSLDPIALIAAIGPMLGLLGTTVGMIGAFATLGKLEGASRSTELTQFMSLALVTTAQGLIVAIPCSVAYSLLRRRLDRIAGEMGELLEDVAAIPGASPAAAITPAVPKPAPGLRPVVASDAASGVRA